MHPIHIIDDDHSVREACQFLLESINEQSILWEHAQHFLDNANLTEAGILILDMRMPHLSGQDLFAHIQANKLPFAVIFLTGHGDIGLAVESLKTGAIDFLEKPVSLFKLQNALGLAKHHLQQRLQQQKIAKLYQNLSQKEQAVSQLVLQGLTNKAIADELSISVRTVEVHRSNAMLKMEAETLASFIIKLEHAQTDS